MVVAVMVLACLCAGTGVFFLFRNLSDPAVSAAPADQPTGFPTDNPTGDPAPGTPTGVVHTGNLERLVVDRPAGARAWPEVKAKQTLNLATAAAAFGDPAQGKTVLQRYGFRDGFTKRWIDARGNRITIRIFRFDRSSRGEDFAAVDISAYQSGDWGDQKSIPDLPDEAAFVKPANEKDGYQQSVAIGAFSDVAVVVIAEQRPPARVSVPENLLAQELDLL